MRVGQRILLIALLCAPIAASALCLLDASEVAWKGCTWTTDVALDPQRVPCGVLQPPCCTPVPPTPVIPQAAVVQTWVEGHPSWTPFPTMTPTTTPTFPKPPCVTGGTFEGLLKACADRPECCGKPNGGK